MPPPNSAAWLLRGAATKLDSRRLSCFVLPLSRSASHRAVAPSFSRVFDRLLDDSFDRHFGGPRDDSRTPGAGPSAKTDTHLHRRPRCSGLQPRSVEGIGRRPPASASRPWGPVVKSDEHSYGRNHRHRREERPARLVPRAQQTCVTRATVSLPAEVDQTASQAKVRERRADADAREESAGRRHATQHRLSGCQACRHVGKRPARRRAERVIGLQRGDAALQPPSRRRARIIAPLSVHSASSG